MFADIEHSYSPKHNIFFCNLGRHSCLWCEITQAEMALPKSEREASTLRTLETLIADNLKFKKAGSPHSKAKLYNNAIRPPIINIPIDQV